MAASRSGAAELLLLAGQAGATAQQVDGAVLGRGHQPGARVGRHAGPRPLLERRHQRVLGQLLGDAHVTHDARQPGDQPR
jgi:hypothetical protein